MTTNRERRKVAVSYSWKEEREGANAGAVRTFCDQLQERRVEVVRDVDRLRHGECISQFMRDIGASDFLCVFLSDAYVRSPNCMVELLTAWERSRDNPEEFRDRVQIWVMPGFNIYDPAARLEITAYWKAERQRRKALIDEHATDGLAGSELDEYRRIQRFVGEVNAMLCFVADTLSPESVDAYLNWIAGEFAAPAPEPKQLERLYDNTIQALERLLETNETLTAFVDRHTTGLVHTAGERPCLCESVRRVPLDVVSPLKAIKDHLGGFAGTRGDWRALEDFVGGLTVMAVEPQWIAEHREILRTGSLEYPGDRETLDIAERNAVHFLHLVAAALADGVARLTRLFGVPDDEDTEKRVPDPPAIFRGVTETDQNLEMKLHFIRYVLPKEDVDPQQPDQINKLFRRVQAAFRYALSEERDPYVASGPRFRELSHRIRTQLSVDGLLLLHPSGTGDEEDLLPDLIFVLKYLHAIFVTNSARRAEGGP